MKILETIISSKAYLTSRLKSIAHPPSKVIILIEDVPCLLTEDNEDLLNYIRTSTTEEHILYVKAVNSSRRCTSLKYNVIFMLNPILDTGTCSNPTEKIASSVMFKINNTDSAGMNKKDDEQIDTVLSLEDSHTSQQAEKQISYKISKDIGFHKAADFIVLPTIVGDSTAHR
ncbi:hypothetical protein Adt_39000 [Abeliophyllum distichum]|uniref:Uncharacterized protein n=1 Tax=Abeliophyllum distichum TaxID=126358 RepID=A0ABD1Q4T1_9LAMI